jgi:hypothetical protein
MNYNKAIVKYGFPSLIIILLIAFVIWGLTVDSIRDEKAEQQKAVSNAIKETFRSKNKL